MKGPIPAQAQLEAKLQPAQQRATETYERILEVTALTLADVGIERLSTNLVCRRAGLSPPALYRYFPNKYALLSVLGQRLMLRQNERVERWISAPALQASRQTLEQALRGLILDTHEVTRETAGGVWIMRAMRAVPVLQEVRLRSHALVTEEQTRLLAQAFPAVPHDQLQLVSRIVVDLVYATVELLFDEPMDAQAVASTVAAMLASHVEKWRRA